MKTAGWIAVQIVGFAAGVVLGYYVIVFSVEYGGSLVAVEAAIAFIIVGAIYVVVRSIHRESVGANRMVTVPLASVVMGMATSATFYGLLFLWIVHLFTGVGG